MNQETQFWEAVMWNALMRLLKRHDRKGKPVTSPHEFAAEVRPLREVSLAIA
jgi:hypothetical protein